MEDFGPQLRLRFESRVYTLAKDADYPEENQDVIRVDEEQGRAAIADGVSASLFARCWARILVEAALSGLPDPDDREALALWLAGLRAAWSRQIDVSRLAWFQRPKLREGAFSTLLCVRLVPPGGSEPALGAGLSTPAALGAGLPTPHTERPAVSSSAPDLRSADRRGQETCAERGMVPDPFSGWRLQGVAVGDSCLFLVRDGSVLRKFPIQTSTELDSDPVVIGSVDLNRDQRISFHRIDEPCRAGDLVVLCTDAIADWALRLEESGSPPSWEDYWDKPESDWREEILAMRAERHIRCDDATLGLLRITDRDRVALPERSDGSGESILGAATPFAAQGVPPDALGAGLPTPHSERPEVSSNAADLRSSERRGQETCAERGGQETCAERQTCAERDEPDFSAKMVPDRFPTAQGWTRAIQALSERAAEGLSQQLARGMEQIKRARKAARAKIKDYLDQLREDDR